MYHDGTLTVYGSISSKHVVQRVCYPTPFLLFQIFTRKISHWFKWLSLWGKQNFIIITIYLLYLCVHFSTPTTY